jgi:hypothetical protein
LGAVGPEVIVSLGWRSSGYRLAANLSTVYLNRDEPDHRPLSREGQWGRNR